MLRGELLLVLLSGCSRTFVQAWTQDTRNFAWIGRETGLSADPSALALGPVTMDEIASGDLTVTNDGANLRFLEPYTTNGAFTVSPSRVEIDVDASTRLTVVYTPSGSEPSVGELVLNADDGAHLVAPLTGTPIPDADGDGYLHPRAGGDDCDDTDPDIQPDATEIWYDGVDQDCDGDDGDRDHDGYDAPVAGGDDCDDTDPDIHPDQPDSYDGVDQDCDGLVDEDLLRTGDVVIDEVFGESSSKSMGSTQWFELYNKSLRDWNPTGWKVQTNGGTGLMAAVRSDDTAAEAASLELSSHQLFVVCADSDPTANGRVPCDAVVVPWPGLDAHADTLRVSAGDLELDQVSWNADWPVQPGASMQLDPDHLDAADNDEPLRWCPAPESWNGVDLGSPGARNADCPLVTSDTGG